MWTAAQGVHSERIRAQMKGAFIMSQNLALLSEITFKNGAVEQENFDTYQVARIDAAQTEISVHLLAARTGTSLLAASESRACRLLRLRSAMQPSPQPASVYARCPSRINWERNATA